MRRCTAKAWDKKAAGGGGWVEVLGFFHQFGITDDSAGCTQTTAIVEDIEGQVWKAEVWSLRFLDAERGISPVEGK